MTTQPDTRPDPITGADRAADPARHADQTWKPLRLLTFYRVILAGLLLLLFFGLTDSATFGAQHTSIYALTATAYFLFGILAGMTARWRYPRYELQAITQILVDITAITLLMHASGGLNSGLGILLVISVATGSILLPGRMAFLFAAFATLAAMGEHAYSLLPNDAMQPGDYAQTGILGLALFATAGVTFLLVRQIRDSDALARRRGIDIANLARLNAHIIQRLQAGIIVTDQNHRIRLVNDTALKLLGLPAAEEGQLLETLAPDLYRKFNDWMYSPEAEPTLLVSEAAGTTLLPQFTLLGADEDQGSLIFLEDTATMARQTQQIKLASLGRLTASIAHEIRNPLGAISHAAQLLDESNALDEGDQRLITIIGDHTRRVNTVVENILQLSRPGSSIPQKIALHAWLDKFTHEFGHSGNCQQEQISFSVTPDDLEVTMDPSLLHQVVWNLCLNATRHAQGSGPLALTLRGKYSTTTHRATLDIIDNGTGIDPEMRDKIFEPFFTTKSSGTGLGLYIAREICESNQAQLDYTQTASGGSCFRIRFASYETLPVSGFARTVNL